MTTSRNSLEKGMLILASVLVLVLILLWLNTDLTLKNARWKAPAAQPIKFQAMLEAVSMPKMNKINASSALLLIQERPLFVMGRTALPAASVTEGGDGVKAWDKVMLLGVFEGAVNGIIFRAEGMDRRLLQGQSFAGWELTAVQPRFAEFIRADQKRILNLQKVDLANSQFQQRSDPAASTLRKPPTAAVVSSPIAMTSQPVKPAVPADQLTPVFGGNAPKNKPNTELRSDRDSR